ncbi:hypothetical protein BU24DRAFT_353348 [Aaosphaeria arxii CBS 175.79]|uniref:Uncharacterized protein n=1 Tax=Aaosphaeria arxii CBS 175.79 TaxID=1450172 RepID=A0A6A5XGF7_9PLEO|nr:uncharacterized protein BU24DRAFT_353348 [Aaosphaeria arxii CBS 175.79]KAF2012315.1 hypothetical protein BU24DRAFT_353348 [Aaosphaeria arxii CBS 175.79]
MAFRQHHRPQPSRQLSIPTPETPAEVGAASSPQRKRTLEESQEWVLFSPGSVTARTHTTSTERTPRTAGLSRFSDFGSLDTAARSEQDEDDITCQGTEEGEDLDSLDDGLHAFHEPSEHGEPSSGLQQSGDTVLPTHDGLGTFQPDANMQDHLWQFERPSPRRRHMRRRSSVQRRLDALEEADELHQEQDRRQRIEKWRLEQSKALLEEIERETRRRRRMSTDESASRVAPSVSDGQSISSDETTENLSFWQRLTRRVIRDLIGLDEDTLSVIFGETLPEETATTPLQESSMRPVSSVSLHADEQELAGEPWEQRLLERVARELGILVSQLSEHPGAFSTYRLAQQAPEYAGLTPTAFTSSISTDIPTTHDTQTSTNSAAVPHFAPTFPQQSANTYSEASLWGIDEEPEVDPLDSLRAPPAATANATEDLAREREYWERELDVKMVFNFLVKRFSRRSSMSSRPITGPSPSHTSIMAGADSEAISARRAAIIRQHHPLVNRTADRLPTSSTTREIRRKDTLYRQHLTQQASVRSQAIRSSSSCASHSTKKSKRSAGSGRNYWDMSGSVGSGSVIAGEV